VAAHDDPHTTWTGAGVRQAACRLYRLFFEVEDFASLLQGICDTLRQELECDRVWLVLEETASGGLICAESGLGDVFAEIKAMLSQGRKPACGRKALAEARLVDCGDCDCPLAGTERHAITAPTTKRAGAARSGSGTGPHLYSRKTGPPSTRPGLRNLSYHYRSPGFRPGKL